MRILFQRLREADLKLKDSKCNYFKTHVQYLGHLVSGKGIKPLPEKLESVKKMPAPTTPKEIKTVPRSGRLLLEVHTKICRYCKAHDKFD